MKSGAVPNYNPTVVPDEAQLAKLAKPPSRRGIQRRNRPGHGVHAPDRWPRRHRARPRVGRAIHLDGSARGQGHVDDRGRRRQVSPIHYRDQTTDRPVSLVDHPYMTLLGNPGDAVNPHTGMSDAFPACGSSRRRTRLTVRMNRRWLRPYLVTGNQDYLERHCVLGELQHAAARIPTIATSRRASSSPTRSAGRRGRCAHSPRSARSPRRRSAEGVLRRPPRQQPRLLQHDLWRGRRGAQRSRHRRGRCVRRLKRARRGGVAEIDFFTSAVGHAVELRILRRATRSSPTRRPRPLAAWSATICWISASAYEFIVRDDATSPGLPDVRAGLRADGVPSVMGLPCDSQAMAERTPCSRSVNTARLCRRSRGLSVELQPALAMAVDAGAPHASDAWTLFAGRSVTPIDYGAEPQFAIVPR